MKIKLMILMILQFTILFSMHQQNLQNTNNLQKSINILDGAIPLFSFALKVISTFIRLNDQEGTQRLNNNQSAQRNYTVLRYRISGLHANYD